MNVLELNLALDEETTDDQAEAGHLLARHRLRRDRRLVPQARPADALPQPGHLHRRDRQRHHDGDLLPRPLRVRRQRAALVHGHHRVLALADGPLRELRRGDRRGPRQGAGERPARDPHDDGRLPALGHGRPRGGAGARSSSAATSSSSRPARSFPPTARSSRASARSTSPPSPASPRRSSARRAATAPPSPAARGCSRTGSSSRSPRSRDGRSSTA